MSLESRQHDEIFCDNKHFPENASISKKLVDKDFGKNSINIDAMNVWSHLSLRVALPNGIMKINPLCHYEEYFKKYYPDVADYIIGRTSKESINEFNRLADAFNKDLARIKKENDIQTVRDYLKKITELLS